MTALKNLNKWAFLYFSPNFSPENNTTIAKNADDTCSVILIGFDPRAKEDNSIIETAIQLKNDGVQFIELCGGFGPTWVTKLNEALDFEIPVGSVTYGPEFRKMLYDIMK